MTKFNFKIPVTGLDNQPAVDQDDKEILLSSLLQSVLTNNNTENFIKHMIWATELYKEGTVSIDEVDQKALLEVIKTNKTMTDLVKYRLYQVLNEKEKV